jgi:predicted acetyltransferase
MGDPVTDFLAVYNQFAPEFNFAKERTQEDFNTLLEVKKLYSERKFSYVLYLDNKPVSYIVFKDIYNEQAAILKVEECAWTSREGFYGLLGFLARFSADYGTITLPLPAGLDLLRIIESPNAYHIQKKPSQCFMVRVINAIKLMETIKKPYDCSFTMQINDEIIQQNNVTIKVLKDTVEVLDKDACHADLVLNVRTLGQLATGCLNIEEALLRKDVTINSNKEMLQRVFIEKKIYVTEHF